MSQYQTDLHLFSFSRIRKTNWDHPKRANQLAYRPCIYSSVKHPTSRQTIHGWLRWFMRVWRLLLSFQRSSPKIRRNCHGYELLTAFVKRVRGEPAIVWAESSFGQLGWMFATACKSGQLSVNYWLNIGECHLVWRTDRHGDEPKKKNEDDPKSL